MIKLLCSILFVLAPVIGETSTSTESEQKKIVFGYLEFAPYYYTNKQGQAEGPLIDLANDITKGIGLDVEFLSLPTKRAVQAVATGEVGMWFGPPTHPLYRNNILKSEKPFMSLELRAVSKKPMSNFNGIGDLIGKSVVVMRGYSYGNIREWLDSPDSQAELFRVTSHAQGLQVLDTRNVDYYLNYTDLLREGLKEYPVDNLYSAVISKLDVHLILNKDYPDAKNVLAQMEEILWLHPFLQKKQQYQKAME